MPWLTLTSRYKLDKNTIINDLTKERPIWILSAYGAGREPPLQLFGGYPREQSFEEIRLHHYELAASGNGQQAIQDIQNLSNTAEQQMQTALNDVDGAIKYIIDGANQHPNRVDICNAKGASTTQTQNSGGGQQLGSIFGRPSTIGQPSIMTTSSQPTNSAFARQATTFGQPSAPGSALSQPSSMEQQPSAFGQPSSLSSQQPALGQTGYDQPSQLGRPATSFGQPSSAFGQSSSAAPTFGQPSAPSTFGQGQPQTSAFSAPSALGSTQRNSTFAKPATAFGTPVASAQQGAFGRPSLPAASNPFAQVQTPAPAATSNWGQSSSAPALPATTAFGQSAAAQPSAFGNAQNGPTATPFAQSSAATTNTPYMNGNNISASNSAHTQARRDAQGKLTSWKGKPVIYEKDEPYFKRSDGALERIWFPDGPPPPAPTKNPEAPDEAYDEATKDNYMYMREHGAFKDGVMPELPPKREWVDWDF